VLVGRVAGGSTGHGCRHLIPQRGEPERSQPGLSRPLEPARQALDLSQLPAGPHTVTFSATDAAGNHTTQTLHLTLGTAIPLTMTNAAPMPGAVDVSVTFRPTVTFSRPIDVTTLTSADFYVSGPDGVKLAATIVPAADGMSAMLFITNPMPGASLVLKQAYPEGHYFAGA
jgi:hypothetical protein